MSGSIITEWDGIRFIGGLTKYYFSDFCGSLTDHKNASYKSTLVYPKNDFILGFFNDPDDQYQRDDEISDAVKDLNINPQDWQIRGHDIYERLDIGLKGQLHLFSPLLKINLFYKYEYCTGSCPIDFIEMTDFKQVEEWRWKYF